VESDGLLLYMYTCYVGAKGKRMEGRLS
jgi:hypothetical protein